MPEPADLSTVKARIVQEVPLTLSLIVHPLVISKAPLAANEPALNVYAEAIDFIVNPKKSAEVEEIQAQIKAKLQA